LAYLFRGMEVMTAADRLSVLRSMGEEFINEDKLLLLLNNKDAPVCYLWVVPSPLMHISQVSVRYCKYKVVDILICTIRLCTTQESGHRLLMFESMLSIVHTCNTMSMYKFVA
jgi:hypothetical protein